VIEMPYVRQAIEFPVRYAYGPDSFPQQGVPAGRVHEFAWNESAIFPATTRRYWVYVPAAYTPSEPAPLMVPGNHGATIMPDALRWLWR
jgi:enterochelin esterase family protein